MGRWGGRDSERAGSRDLVEEDGGPGSGPQNGGGTKLANSSPEKKASVRKKLDAVLAEIDNTRGEVQKLSPGGGSREKAAKGLFTKARQEKEGKVGAAMERFGDLIEEWTGGSNHENRKQSRKDWRDFRDKVSALEAGAKKRRDSFR